MKFLQVAGFSKLETARDALDVAHETSDKSRQALYYRWLETIKVLVDKMDEIEDEKVSVISFLGACYAAVSRTYDRRREEGVSAQLLVDSYLVSPSFPNDLLELTLGCHAARRLDLQGCMSHRSRLYFRGRSARSKESVRGTETRTNI